MTPISTDSNPVSGKHDQLTRRMIGINYEVYNELGSGFLESIYKECLRIALVQSGLTVETEVSIPVSFRGHNLGTFRADLVVNGSVLVELNACDALVRQHESQTLNYLRPTTLEVALLMNFGPTPSFKRLIMDNNLKARRSQSGSSVPIGVKSFAPSEVTS